jgi:hypothetical protein
MFYKGVSPEDLEPEAFLFFPEGLQSLKIVASGPSRGDQDSQEARSVEMKDVPIGEKEFRALLFQARIQSLPLETSTSNGDARPTTAFLVYEFRSQNGESRSLPIATYINGELISYCRPWWREGPARPGYYPL